MALCKLVPRDRADRLDGSWLEREIVERRPGRYLDAGFEGVRRQVYLASLLRRIQPNVSAVSWNPEI
jgi:hypothetical protein